MCQQHLTAWKVLSMEEKSLRLENCTRAQLERGDKLFLFVSRGPLSDYGKYRLVKVKKVQERQV